MSYLLIFFAGAGGGGLEERVSKALLDVLLCCDGWILVRSIDTPDHTVRIRVNETDDGATTTAPSLGRNRRQHHTMLLSGKIIHK